MKIALQLLACLLAVVCTVRPEPAAAAAARSISGREYVRLNDWARANRLTVKWLSPQRIVELSNGTHRLVFTVDPRADRTKVRINGAEVSLAFPAYQKNGVAFVTQIDLTQTLKPILFPTRSATTRVKTICIDAGHGGKDPGFRVGAHSEKKYTLLLAQELRRMLQQAGFNVVMTRTTDTSVERETRPALARSKGADLFVSLHFNAFPRSAAVKGVEVYCLTPAGAFSSNSGGEGDTRWVSGNRHNEKNIQLAYQIHRALIRELAAEDRGVKRARFEVLRLAAMPAVLIEGGFMSNPTEGKRIFDAQYRSRMARAITDGIIAYKKAVNG
jgi:N-acetylmuramoyl-L-alanine amidase